MAVEAPLKLKYRIPSRSRFKSPNRSSSKESSLSKSERRRQRYKHGAVTPPRLRYR